MANKKQIVPRNHYVTLKDKTPTSYTSGVGQATVVAVGEDVKGLSAGDEVVVRSDLIFYRIPGFDEHLVDEMYVIAVVKS